MNVIELSAAHRAAVDRRRRIICQEDGISPFGALGMDMREWLEYRLNLIDTAGCQIDAIIWDVGLCADSYAVYQKTRLLPQVDFPGLNEWRKQGIDFLETLVTETHKRGREAFWNERISEVDMPQPFCSCPHESPLRENYLKKAHPDWVVKCWWPQGLWNLANPELRRHKIRRLKELVENYDLDGLQLDFARHTPCLPPEAEWKNREHVTEFVRMTRTMLQEMEKIKDKPLLLAVRVAETIDGCHRDGFEVEKWAKENLVDVFTLGGRTGEVDIEAFKRITHGKNIKLCPSFDGHHTNDGYYHPPFAYYRGVFSNWLEQGADSVGVFNWTCAGEEVYDSLSDGFDMKCRSQRDALFEAGCLADMRDKAKLYAVERRGGYPWAGNYLYRNDDKPLPFKVSNGSTLAELPVFIYTPCAADKFQTTLDIITWRISIAEIAEVRMNGRVLPFLSSDDSWTDPQIYCDKPQPTCGGWKCFPIAPEYKLLKATYELPADCLKIGRNIVSVRCESTETGELRTIEKIEVHTHKNEQISSVSVSR